MLQGDRKAGPSLSAFNYESTWGQKALKRFYRVVLGVSPFQPVALTHLTASSLGPLALCTCFSAMAHNATPCKQMVCSCLVEGAVS